MSIGDFVILEQASMTGRGSRTYNVAAGATAIYAGEPVIFGDRASVTVIAMPTNNPVSGSDYFVGIAQTNSTQTSGTAGTVGVFPADQGTTWLVSPNAAGSWDTQAEYNALVNKSVLVNLTSGVYTVLATDSANNGLKVMPINIIEHPGKVAIAFRNGVIDTR